MLTLAQLIKDVPGSRVVAGGDVPISHITADSRSAEPGSAFICIRGFATDGHLYAADAVAKGAVAVIRQDESALPALPSGTASAVVPDSRKAAAIIANAFYGHPSRDLHVVGVTGTNGKTTTVYLVDSILSTAGRATGIITTLERRIGDNTLPTDRTTPDALELQSLLRQMADAGVTDVAMEISSHALELSRTTGTKFDVAVFTNLSQDHLDFHADIDEYFRSKLLLFTDYADAARPEKQLRGVVNTDDPYGREIARQARCPVITYGLSDDADVRARNIKLRRDGTDLELDVSGDTAAVALRLVGLFNVYNALAAAACAAALGTELDAIEEGLRTASAPRGRFERVDEGQPFGVVVDYAHTPDGLRNVLRAARELGPKRLLVIFGCGGDRDRSKRPLMARVAEELADVVIVTSDNPRSETPEAIIAEIVAGFREKDFVVEPDRRAAIRRGIEMCRPDDLLLIAGKGHETYQIFADRTIHFDDREVAAEFLRKEVAHS